MRERERECVRERERERDKVKEILVLSKLVYNKETERETDLFLVS